MPRVWLLVLFLLTAGCATPQPGPPPEGTEGADEDAPDANDTDDGEEPPMELSSPAFSDGDPIPTEHTADGEDRSPPLETSHVPEETQALALIVDDPDAPREEPWVHWLIWNVPPEADAIPEGYPPSGEADAFEAARQGTNDFGDERYNGPSPPEGDGPHRYRFQLFALERPLDVDEGAQRAELEEAMEDALITEDTLAGTYER